MTLNASGLNAVNWGGGVPNIATGKYTGDGSGSINVTLGFMPRHVKVFDETDATVWEWWETMSSTVTLKTVTNGTTTADTGTAISSPRQIVESRTVVIPQGATPGTGVVGDGTMGTEVISVYGSKDGVDLLLATALNVNAKVYSFIATV